MSARAVSIYIEFSALNISNIVCHSLATSMFIPFLKYDDMMTR